MKFKYFKDHFDGAPYDELTFAEEAAKITDNTELSTAAKNYIKAYDRFKEAMENAGVEPG